MFTAHGDGESRSSEGFMVSPQCTVCTVRGAEKGRLASQRCVIPDAKRQHTGSVKASAMTFVREDSSPGRESPS